MSTIERAMRKMRGETEPTSERADPDALVSVVDATAKLSDEQRRENDARAVEPDFGDKNAENAILKPGNTTVQPDLAREQVTISSETIDAESEPALEARDTQRTINLDFERLKSLGFLVPGDTSMQLSEAYQTVKRRLIANTIPGALETDGPKNVIMITSSMPGEGKTYTSMNLALSIAMEVEQRVLLVDVDIIKSDLSRLAGVANRTGLFDVLASSGLRIEDVIVGTNIPSLSLVPAGTIRQKITENLASKTMAELTQELATRYSDRVVIFDCPPILATSSAVALAPIVGQIALVVESCQTTRHNLNRAIGMIGDTKIVGTILNKVRHRGVSSAGYYDYGYGYGYGYGGRDRNT